MKRPILELKDVTKEYGSGTSRFKALDKVSLSINEGEFVSITGPSGSGKSTLLHFLGFLDKPTSGEVCVDGAEMGRMGSDQLAEVRNGKIGFVFQAFNLAPTLTVGRNVELPLTIGGMGRKERRKKAERLLGAVGMLGKWDSMPSQLSGGERQRAAIARALANNPRIILADEPTGNLDSKSGKEVLEILHGLWERDGKTIVIITHEPVVAAYAERNIKLRDGKIERDTKQRPRKAGEDEIKVKK